jgi:hypothetical protein
VRIAYGTNHLDDLGVGEGNIELKLQELGLGHGLDCYGSGGEQVAGACECGTEPFVFIKCDRFLDKLRTG